MRRVLRGQRVLVHRGEELHARRERLEVVPLVLERERAGTPAVDGSRCDDVDRAVLDGAVVVVVGVAQQAFVPLPVVFGAERVVDADEAAAARMYWRSAVLAASRCALVVVLTAASGRSRVPCCPQRVAAGAGEDDGLVLVPGCRAA
jgi:hypothetical protein